MNEVVTSERTRSNSGGYMCVNRVVMYERGVVV